MTTYAFPGYVGDVVALAGRIEASWGNAIRDRTVQVFATATDRDAAITSPKIGQTCFLTDHGSLMHYQGATVGWQKPWSMPWGIIGTASVTASQTAIGAVADLTSLVVTYTAVANRRIAIHGWGRFIKVTGGGYAELFVTANGADRSLFYQAIPDGETQTCDGTYLDSPSAGSTTYKLRARGNESTGTATFLATATNPGRILVEDIGPNGDPS